MSGPSGPVRNWRGTIKVFAYGSNLSGDRLRARAPSARFIGRACLDGYALRFHKRGADGSGKADAFRTGSGADRVWGAVFECPEDEKAILDRIEGVGNGYDEATVAVELDDGILEIVRIYVAEPAAIDASLEPYTWYHDYVLTGAEEQGLPAGYIAGLRRQFAVPDPDTRREARNTPVPGRWEAPRSGCCTGR